MPNGDAAAAAGMDVVLGTEDIRNSYSEINKTRDYIATRVQPIATGGTGASTASAARNALGIIGSNVPTLGVLGTGSSQVQADLEYLNGQVTGAQSAASAAASAASAASANANARVAKGGDTMSGDLFLPAASPASSGWTAAYINGDGRVCKGASSARFKDEITAIHPATLGNLFPELKTYVMKEDPGRMQRVGYIAEELDASDDLRRFVVYEREVLFDENGHAYGSTRKRDKNGQSIPESIDFIALLMAQVAQLHARVLELESRGDGLA